MELEEKAFLLGSFLDVSITMHWFVNLQVPKSYVFSSSVEIIITNHKEIEENLPMAYVWSIRCFKSKLK